MGAEEESGRGSPCFALILGVDGMRVTALPTGKYNKE